MPEKRSPQSSTPKERPREERKDAHARSERQRRGVSGDRRERRDPRERREPRGERSEPASKYGAAHLSDEVTKDLRATARPGKEDILVKVFSEAVAAYFEGDFKEAIRLGDQSKHMALRSASAREFLGLAHYQAGNWAEAIKELAAFKRITGSLEQNHVLADSYRATGKPEKALELCEEVLGSRPDAQIGYEAAIVAAGALADMKRVDDAIKWLESLDLQPAVAQEHHLRAWYVLADLLERKGRYTQARTWFEAVAGADADLTDAPERAAKLAAS
jgi:tetratricopeptide (TPR) repeat protein